MAIAATASDGIGDLRARLRGPLLLPEDAGYDAARRVWNGMIDRLPAAIARCTGPADVMAAIRFARQHALPVSVRSGGHNVSGNAICEGGIVIDLGAMRSVRVDPERGLVRVGGGALLGDLDHETQAHGRAVPVGAVSETGIGGLALHGGLGFLTRKYGLTADNLVSADVVTAEGELVTADERQHSDLLWALKGGGGGFGVVTSFEFQTHPLGPDVYFLLTFYAAADAPVVLERFRAFMPEAADELMAIAIYWNAPEEEFIPPEYRGRPAMIVAGCWCGPIEEGDRATRPLRTIGAPIADLSGPMPYLAVQKLFDADYPSGRRYYWKSLYLDDLSDELIGHVCRAGAERPTPISTVEVWALGGAMSRVGREETPFFHRDAPFLLAFEANAEDATTDDANVNWVRRRYDEAGRFSRRGTYYNFGGFFEGGDETLSRSFGSNLERLRDVKARYDPHDLFRQSVPIRSAV